MPMIAIVLPTSMISATSRLSTHNLPQIFGGIHDAWQRIKQGGKSTITLALLAGLIGCSEGDSTELDAETTQKSALLVADTDADAADDNTIDANRSPDGTTTLQEDGTYLQTVTISQTMLDNIKSFNILLALDKELQLTSKYPNINHLNFFDGLKDFFNTTVASSQRQPRMTCIDAHYDTGSYRDALSPCRTLKLLDKISATIFIKKMMGSNSTDPSGLDLRILSTLINYDSTNNPATPNNKIFVGSPKTHHNLLITVRTGRYHTHPNHIRLSAVANGNHYDTTGLAAQWFVETYESLSHFQLFHLDGTASRDYALASYEGQPLPPPTKFSGRYFDKLLTLSGRGGGHSHIGALRQLQSTFRSMTSSILDHVYLPITAEHFVDEIISITIDDSHIDIPAHHYKKSGGSTMKLLYPLEPEKKIRIVYRGTPYP